MQDGHVNRIFFRFFVLVMLSITGATFVIYFAFSRLFGDPLEDIARRQAAAQIFLLEQYVDKAPSDEWLTRLNNVRTVSEVRYDLVPLPDARAALAGAQGRLLWRARQPRAAPRHHRGGSATRHFRKRVGNPETPVHAVAA